MIRPGWLSPLLALIAAAMSSGCGPSQAQYNQVQEELTKKTAALNQASVENDRLAKQVAQQDERILSLLALGDKRLEKLFYVKSISLGDYTGGYDSDGKSGDDAIKVFLLPMDQYGSIIKAAGEVKIQLFDLAAPPAENLLGEYSFDVDQVGKSWASGFLTYHFSFVCPWKVLPKHNQVTVRVEFVDYLTGRHFSAQKICTINLPPAPATAETTKPS